MLLTVLQCCRPHTTKPVNASSSTRLTTQPQSFGLGVLASMARCSVCSCRNRPWHVTLVVLSNSHSLPESPCSCILAHRPPCSLPCCSMEAPEAAASVQHCSVYQAFAHRESHTASDGMHVLSVAQQCYKKPAQTEHHTSILHASILLASPNTSSGQQRQKHGVPVLPATPYACYPLCCQVLQFCALCVMSMVKVHAAHAGFNSQVTLL